MVQTFRVRQTTVQIVYVRGAAPQGARPTEQSPPHSRAGPTAAALSRQQQPEAEAAAD
eukprot:SAG11_NODE_16541_length_544_cov_1.964045_1_plen_57_part_10